jgi:hypothetical protein
MEGYEKKKPLAISYGEVLNVTLYGFIEIPSLKKADFYFTL